MAMKLAGPKVKGFSLIEALVAIAILSAVILIANSFLSALINRWGNETGLFEKAIKTSKSTLSLMDQMGAIFPYVAIDQGNVPRIYFEGNENGFISIINEKNDKSSNEVVLRVSLEEDQSGTFRVIRERWQLPKGRILRINEEIPFGPPELILGGLSSAQFSYLGWESLEDREAFQASRAQGNPPNWTNRHNALSLGMMPLSIGLTIANEDGVKQLVKTPNDAFFQPPVLDTL